MAFAQKQSLRQISPYPDRVGWQSAGYSPCSSLDPGRASKLADKRLFYALSALVADLSSVTGSDSSSALSVV